MALRTNSKAANNNIMEYIRQAADYITDNGYKEAKSYNLNNDIELSACIWEIFQIEKYYSIETMHRMHLSMYEVFKEWAQGLALNLFDYYYNVSAIETLGNILEQTETERNKYNERQAEETLTRLIYRQIDNNRRKYTPNEPSKDLIALATKATAPTTETPANQIMEDVKC